MNNLNSDEKTLFSFVRVCREMKVTRIRNDRSREAMNSCMTASLCWVGPSVLGRDVLHLTEQKSREYTCDLTHQPQWAPTDDNVIVDDNNGICNLNSVYRESRCMPLAVASF